MNSSIMINNILSISDIINHLQIKNIIPNGKFEYEAQDHPFSYIYRVSIGAQVFYFKILKQRINHSPQAMIDRLLNEYEALKKYNSYFNTIKYFCVVEPVYCSKEYLLLVTRELKGETLLDKGKRYASRSKYRDSRALYAYNNAGVFLKTLHKMEVFPYNDDDLESLINYIYSRIQCGVFNDNEERTVLDYLNRSSLEIKINIGRYYKCPTHHDYVPGNILSQNGDIKVLDFGDFAIDSNFQDIVTFMVMLRRQLENRIKYRKEAIDELLEAFIRGYGFDYNLFKDKMYELYLIKYYAIMIASFSKTSKWYYNFQESVNIKTRMVNIYEYYKIKKIILGISDNK